MIVILLFSFTEIMIKYYLYSFVPANNIKTLLINKFKKCIKVYIHYLLLFSIIDMIILLESKLE